MLDVSAHARVQGIALVITALNVVLRHLGALLGGREVRELRETALGYINEGADAGLAVFVQLVRGGLVRSARRPMFRWVRAMQTAGAT